MAQFAVVLMFFGTGAFVVALCGAMNDHHNRYPLPLLLAGAFAFAMAGVISWLTP